MRIALLGFVLLFAGVARTWAAFYFVDYVGGSDANVGTAPGQAWKHCPGDPAAGGLAAAAVLVPGDTVRFKGGIEYVLTAATGIRLDWDGAAGARVTYDGNSDGSWGAGRAVLTDQHGGNAISAFSTTAARRHLAFRAFEFYALGGAAVLPSDLGNAVPARFGCGITLAGGAEAVLIEDCAFRELGYWQNQRPLAADSLAGAGITAAGRVHLTISRCTFSRIAKGCDLAGTNGYSSVKLDQCTFGEALIWPLDLPPDFGSASVLSLDVETTTFPASSPLYGSGWTGYGVGPLETELIVPYGELVVFSASALASPAATFQWFKDGTPLAGALGSRLELGMADAGDAGRYSVVATNALGEDTSNAIVLVITGAPPLPPPSTSVPTGGGAATSLPQDIPQAPAITQQPQSQSVKVGSIVSFTVIASGSPAPSYQWEKNGLPISGATGAVLTLPAVTLLDAASYRVVVGNASGIVASSPATLVVSESEAVPLAVAPVIVQQPMSLTVLAGSTAAFGAGATGTPLPAYQWEKNGVPITGATSSILILPAVSGNDAASYRVVVSNTAGSTASHAATLTVSGSSPVAVAPTITQQPESVTALTGSTVTLAVAATGTPAPSYQWERNGAPIAGATSAVLLLPSLSSNDAGTYRVLVTNSAGAVMSQPATLTVTEPAPVAVAPTITQQPESVTALTGSTVTLAVAATGTPAPSYQWERNGAPIAGATGAVLLLPSLSSNDAGTYRVLVTNSAGAVMSQPATLTVTEPAPVAVAPTITQQPESVTALTGSTVTLAVAATGTPAPSYQWERNGAPITGATSAVLLLPSLSSNDAGTYRVLVTNSAGAVISQPATLTVTEPAPVAVAPTITQQPQSLSVDLGSVATFSIVATGTPAPSYQWERNGQPIAGATTAVLSLPTVKLDDAGSYRVVIGNSAGSVTSLAAVLTVVEPPAPPPSSPPPPLVFASYAIRHTYHWVAVAFTVPGDSARRVLVRALGPTFAALGGAGAVADPKFDLYQGTGGDAFSNDNWGGNSEIALASAQAGAAPFVNPASADAALVVNLPPGQHVLIVGGVNGSIGNVLVEVYLLP